MRCQKGNLPCSTKILASNRAARKVRCGDEGTMRQRCYQDRDRNLYCASLVKENGSSKETKALLPIWDDGMLHNIWVNVLVEFTPRGNWKITDFGLSGTETQVQTTASHPIQQSMFWAELFGSVNHPNPSSAGTAGSELPESSSDMSAISQNLVRILQHHFPAVDPNTIAAVVQRVGSRFNNDAVASSPAPSSSTVPENGSPLPENHPLKDSGKSV